MGISKKDIEKAKSRITETTDKLTQNMEKKFMRKSITIDEKTLSKIEEFQKEKGLDFSSAIRFIANDYFSNNH